MAQTDQVMFRLHQALESGALPPQGRKIGMRLMSQLHEPTRVAVVGLPGAGKSRLINLILGADLMPEYEGVAAVELGYGEVARTQFTLADGTISFLEGVAGQGDLPAGTARVSVLRDNPALKGWSVTEIGLIASPRVQIDLLEWMSGRSNFAIWCSTRFDEREHALWSAVPDVLKDNSFLALTRADRLFMKGELEAQIARLRPIVADEFRALYPVATLQAAAARLDGGIKDRQLWRSSGGMALVDGIRSSVEQARSADLDHAFMLLERFKVPGGAEGAAPEAVAPALAPAPAQPAEILVPQPLPAASPQLTAGRSDAVIRKALGVLRGCADELIAVGGPAHGDTTDHILERCNATAHDLVELMSENEGGSDALESVREDVIEGEQMLMLLRLERGDTAAEDSLTVLLQMKKELSQRIAG